MGFTANFDQFLPSELILITFFFFVFLKLFAKDKIVNKKLFILSFISIICSLFLTIALNLALSFQFFSFFKSDFDFSFLFSKNLNLIMIYMIPYVISILLLALSWIGLIFAFKVFDFKESKTFNENNDN